MFDLAAACAARWAPHDATPEVLSARGDVLVVGAGPVVVKVHHCDTDGPGLTRRLAFASSPRARDVLVTPLASAPERADGRLLSVWPRAHVLGVDDLDAAPWADLGRLAARLHRLSPNDADRAHLPPARAAHRVADAVARLAARPVLPGDSPGESHGEARAIVLAAARALPAWTVGDAPAPGPHVVIHGDLHLGQLARLPAGSWRLLDVDDLGLGPPAWDLARPAAWFAAGVLDPADWAAFLDAYRDARGPAVPADGDPWPGLDAPARALAVQTAARAVVEAIRENRELDPVADAFVRVNAKIVADGGAGTPRSSS